MCVSDLSKNYAQRPSIEAVGILVFRPPITAAEKSYFVEVKSKSSKLLVLPGLKFGFKKLLIDLPSSPNCCNTFVGRSF